MKDAADVLEKIKGNDALISPSPETLDFTDVDRPANIIIQGAGVKATLPLADFKDIEHLSGALPPYFKDGLLVAWNLKPINSYLLGRTEYPVRWESTPYDLKIIEHYLGIEKNKPETTNSAKHRLAECIKSPGWKLFEPFYRQVYVPLINDVIPAMETNCLTHRERKECVYACYEIEGQANGRLKTSKSFRAGFTPHSMSPDEKSKLSPTVHEELFFYFDYNHMEVSVLAWLSQDPALLKILDSGRDLYEAIWKSMTGLECSERQREMCKGIFLPVIYGQGAKSLAKRLEIGENFARSLIDKIYKTFPTATTWVKSQHTDSLDYATDVWGRRRKFDLAETYKVRNFCIQSPASMICLTKLVHIHQKLGNLGRLAFHLHDGYCILVKSRDWKSGFRTIKEELESDDDLFPGLRLKTSCAAGQDLNNLKTIKLSG